MRKLFWTNAVQRRNRSMQHVIDAAEVFRFLNRANVCRFFHHAYETLIAGRARAVDTGIDISDVVADRAQVKIGFHVANRGSQFFSVFVARTQHMKGKALRALASDSGSFLNSSISRAMGSANRLIRIPSRESESHPASTHG